MNQAPRQRKSLEDLERSLWKELTSFGEFDWLPQPNTSDYHSDARFLSDFDLSPDDEGAWRELDRGIADFLANSEDQSDEIAWEGEFSGGIERLAWYQPLSFYGPSAGIFITTRGLLIYTRRFLQGFQRMANQPPHARALAFKCALASLLAHEAFHHDVESFALKLSATVGRTNLYSSYHSGVYGPNSKPLNDSLIEEALASAVEYRAYEKYLELGHLLDNETRAVIAQEFFAGYPQRPPGYREGAWFVSNPQFSQGCYSLVRQIAEGQLVTGGYEVPPHFKIGKGRLHDAFVDNAILVDNLNTPRGSILTLAVPSRRLEQYVRSRGFEEVAGRGKGSHSVWKGPNGEMITLPHRKDQQGFNTLKSAATTLGFDTARDLVVEVSK